MYYTKRNQRCISKEDMPHAQKTWQKSAKKRKKRCIPKEGMPHVHKTCQKKEEKKKKQYSPCLRKKIYKERDRSYKGVHPLSTKNIPHTCTSWSDCMTHFCLDLVFDLTI